MTAKFQSSSSPDQIPWNSATRLILGIFLSILSAFLLTASMPPRGFWLLAVLGFAPMTLAQHRILPRRWSSLGSAITIGGLIGLYIMPAFLSLPGSPWYMKLLPLIFGLFVFAADSKTRSFHEVTGYHWFVLNGAFGWVGIEMIRSMIPVLGTWGFIAYAFYRVPWLIQPVSIFGVFGMSMITLLAGYALGLILLAWFDRCWILDKERVAVDGRLALRWIKRIGAVSIFWTALSLLLLQPAGERACHIAALQPGFRLQWTEEEKATNWLETERYHELYDELLITLVSQTKELASQDLDMVVWPEGALNFDPQQEHSAELRALAADMDVYLVLPYGVGYRNEVTVLSPEGEFLGVYGKNHPVVFVHEESATRGTYPVYDTKLGKIGTIICYDMDFTDTARRIANNGADLIAVPSGDWSGIGDKHFAHLVFRAVENRAAMVKADRNFDSAIIDPYGRILALIYASVPEQKTLTAMVGTTSFKAVQCRLGDWVGWISLAGLATFAVGTPVVLNRAR
ncbi:MAG: apolipoprotein N-acyltransferase [Anaerolineales bacterium]|nr:apolipoprotein N-acyltransferase [Anaerolineales bacterium]